MYCSHFKLHRLPFNNTPDPTFYYSTPDHEEALATLQYATQQRKGFVLVTGEIGAGKTLIGRMFLRQMDGSARTAVITNTHLNARQLLAAICAEFNLECPAEASNLDLTQRLQEYLLEQFASNRHVVVLLDEGQNLPDQAFEELRMLGNLEADDAKLLQVCILGQPELRERFRRPTLRQLDQRLFRRFHLPALSLEQTGEYIRHRIRVAGGADREIFTPDAVARIHAASHGIPRTINQLCDNCLLTGYGQDVQVIDASLVEQVLDRDAVDSPAIAARATDSDTDDTLADVDAGRLTELAQEEASSISAQISRFQAGTQVDRGELERLAGRQNELQKIVGGATTRWLAAKEKLEAYRNEIQTTIRDVSARCSRTQQQLDELARTTAPSDELEEIRHMHLRETQRVLTAIGDQRAELMEIQQQAEKRWLETRERFESFVADAATAEMLQEVNAEQERRMEHLLAHLEQHRTQFTGLIDEVRQRCDATQAELRTLRTQTAEARAESDRAMRSLDERLTGHEDTTRTLLAGIAERYGQVQQSLASLEQTRATAEDLESLRTAHAAAASELSGALTRQLEGVRRLRSVFLRGATRVSGRQKDLRRELQQRIEQQESRLETVRTAMEAAERRVQEAIKALRDSSVSRTEFEAAQSTQRESHGELSQRLAAVRESAVQRGEFDAAREDDRQQRHEISRNVATLQEDLASARHQVQQITASKAEQEQLSDLQRRHEADVTRLLGELDRQRQDAHERYQQVIAYCRKTEESVATLSDSVTDPAAIEALRRQQETEMQRVLTELAEHRGELDTMIRGANQRCEDVLARIGTLPSAEQIQAAQQEHERQIADVLARVQACRSDYEDAIRRALQRCEKSQADLEALAQRTASREEVDTLRTEQDRKMEALSQSVSALAERTPPREAITAIEQTLTQGLSALGEEVQQVRGEQQTHLRTLATQVHEHSERVRALEEADRPAPLQIELTPRAAVELGELVDTADREKGQLTVAIERAGAIAAHLHNTSAQVQEVMEHWMGSAGAVREQSEQLRASAEMASNILKAMQRCGAALEAKLNSETWQTEMNRGEQLARRIEQATGEAKSVCRQLTAALNDFESCRTEVEGWTERRTQATQLTGELARLVEEARNTSTRVERTIDGRKKLLAAIAKNTSGLVEVIQAARAADEQRRPSTGTGRVIRNGDDVPSAAEWPRIKTPAKVG